MPKVLAIVHVRADDQATCKLSPDGSLSILKIWQFGGLPVQLPN